MKIIAAVLVFCSLVAVCGAAPVGDEVQLPVEILDQLSVQEVNRFVELVNEDLKYGAKIPELNGETLRKIAAGGMDFSVEAVGGAFFRILFQEIILNVHLMGKLIFLAVLCSLLQNLQSAFAESSVALLAHSVCFVFLAVFALNVFAEGILLSAATVGNMVGFMEALLPLLLSLLAGVGAVMTAALFTPLMLMTVSVMGQIVKNAVLPLLLLTAVLECVNYLTGRYKLSNLAGILKQASLAVLGFSMVIFVGISSIQGAAGSVADGLALRTAKYAAGTFIPVLGKMFADTVELMLGASLLLKNAVGIFGIMAIVLLCVIPLVKLVSLIIVIKTAGAIIQPLGDERLAQCLNAMGNNLLLVFAALLTVAIMFFLTITMILGMGNIALMLK
ncbi:MAG: stage III sporulation protein AE [Sporomusaceae bacterium]|jgi:stage III sporulation protein AE|nr:stage III sporulation protein AE [Sporomusaceae bacterium]